MSVQCIAMAFAFDAPSPTTKLVLLALANYADENAQCVPPVKKIVAETGLSDRPFDDGEVGGGETGETHAGGEDGVFEHQIGLTREESADGFGDGGRLALAESQAFETATDDRLVG